MTSSAERLPRSVAPRHYDIELEPDLVAGTFSGRVSIELDIAAPTDRIVCNALDLDVQDAQLSSRQSTASLGVELDRDNEWLIATSSTTIPAGPAQLTFRFTGELNDKLRGFYRSTYQDDAGAVQTLAVTQFEATDARRAFPCWDEPDFKASYRISLVVPPDMLAVSNSPIEAEDVLVDGRRRVVFAPTMVMSAYLVAFAVGPLVATDPITVDGVPLRVIARPDRLHLAHAALDIAGFSLRYLREYFDRPYPGDKLDLVAIPDFAFGAMENLGCVTFRETALLVDPAEATQHEMQRVVDVIAHEIAHMWFGDLVTMRWWNGIWLNEAFATFMETKTTDAYRPDWHRWNDFGLARTAAFDVDSLSSTRPIEFEVRSPADAEAMFDVLTYEKGGAVVRMLEQYLGEDRFREGIRQYIARHAFGNTDTSELWDSIEAVTHEPVRRIMESWIFQGGYPAVTGEAIGPDRVRLRQSRFGFTVEPTDTIWSIPLRLRIGRDVDTAREERVVLDRPEIELTLPGPSAQLVTLNADASGFYRTDRSEADLEQIGRDGPAGLSAIERYTLVDDAYAFVLADRLPASALLELLNGFRYETDLSVWERIVAVLDALARVAGLERSDRFEARVQNLLRPKYDELASLAIDDERLLQLRAVLFGALGRLGSDAAIITAARRIVTGEPADPALTAAAISTVAAHATAGESALLLDRFRRADSPQQEERYRSALVDTPGTDAFDAALAMTLSGEIRSQDAPYLLARAMGNKHHGFAAWHFVTDHWAEVNERFPSNSIARMLSGIVSLAEAHQAPAVESFLQSHPVPQGQKAVDQHRERLAVNARLRARERVRLAAALTAE